MSLDQYASLARALRVVMRGATEGGRSERTRTMPMGLLQLIESNGDADLGAAIDRLARLAEAVHRFESTKRLQDAAISLPQDHGRNLRRAEGLSSRPHRPDESHDGSSVHKEVNG